MHLIQAVVLGIIQGLTEFIPISSSAHLIVFPWIFNWNDPVLDSLVFDIALHMGTLIALCIFFAKDWAALIRAGFASIIERKIAGDFNRKMAWFIVIGSIPGGIIGFLFEKRIDKLFHSIPINPKAMLVMALVVAGAGLLLLAADVFAKHTRNIDKIKFSDAILIGLAQSLAIFPGVSRSGSTITAGLALGISRESAARFSFLLSAPIIAGAGLKSIFDLLKQTKVNPLTREDMAMFAAGFIAAAVTGFFCIKILLRFLQKHSTLSFVIYRLAFALLIAVTALVRM